MFCKFCGRENIDGAGFCKHCGKIIGVTNKTEEEIFIKEEEGADNIPSIPKVDKEPITKEVLVDKVKKNKAVAILISAVALIGIVVIGFSVFGSTIKKSTLEKDMIGKTIGIGSMSFTIDEGSLKSVKVKSEKEKVEQGVKFCEVNGTVSLENEIFTVEAPFKAEYMYSNNEAMGEKGWYLTGMYIDVNSKEAKVEVNAKVSEDDFKKALVGKEIKVVKITEDMFKDIKITNVETTDFGTRATGEFALNYDGKMLSKVVSCNVTIKLNEGKWEYVNINNAKTLVTVKKDAGDIAVDDFVKDFNTIAGKGSVEASYKSMDCGRFDVDDIKEVKNVKVTEDVAWNKRRYIIDADVKLVSKKATAEGPIRISIVEEQVSGDFRVKATSFVVDEPKKDDILSIFKETIISHKSGEEVLKYKLKDSDVKTFNVTEVVQKLPNPRDFVVYGTMTYNGLTNDNVAIFVFYDISGGVFRIREAVSFSVEGNSENKGIEAIKAKNKEYIEREIKGE